jgi:hypothetical protein
MAQPHRTEDSGEDAWSRTTCIEGSVRHVLSDCVEVRIVSGARKHGISRRRIAPARLEALGLVS